MEHFNKHYIRMDDRNRIIYGFSDAFEEEGEGDICISEMGGRQFELLEEINPPLVDENGVYRYRYENGEIVKRSEEERQADIPPIVVLPDPRDEAIATLMREVALLKAGGKNV